MNRVRVLVPLDGSEMAEAALSYVTTLRGLGPLRVRLVAVAEDPRRYGLAHPDEWQERQAHILREYLALKQSQFLEQHKDVEVESAVRLGYPADVLFKDAEQFQAGYVVTATHGHTGTDRWRLGSVADKIIRSSEWNTLVVGPQPATWPLHHHVRSIMVPLDGSKRAEAAIPIAAAIAEERGAQVHLVRVVEKPLRIEDITGYALAVSEDAARAYLEETAENFPDLAPPHLPAHRLACRRAAGVHPGPGDGSGCGHVPWLRGPVADHPRQYD